MSFYAHTRDTEPFHEAPAGVTIIEESLTAIVPHVDVNQATSMKLIDTLLAKGWVVVPISTIGREIFK